jgi:hypothetical protein
LHLLLQQQKQQYKRQQQEIAAAKDVYELLLDTVDAPTGGGMLGSRACWKEQLMDEPQDCASYQLPLQQAEQQQGEKRRVILQQQQQQQQQQKQHRKGLQRNHGSHECGEGALEELLDCLQRADSCRRKQLEELPSSALLQTLYQRQRGQQREQQQEHGGELQQQRQKQLEQQQVEQDWEGQQKQGKNLQQQRQTKQVRQQIIPIGVTTRRNAAIATMLEHRTPPQELHRPQHSIQSGRRMYCRLWGLKNLHEGS